MTGATPPPAGGEGAVSSYENSNLAVTTALCRAPSKSAIDDGAELARQCLAKLQDRERFPPALFILWATPAFKTRYRDLLAGVHHVLDAEDQSHVPLIGASVAVCLYEEEVYEEGAILICLASRFLHARVVVAEEATTDPSRAVEDALQQLDLSNDPEINSRQNQFLITFLPGYDSDGTPSSYRAPEILHQLRTQTESRLHTFGGVASGGLERNLGYQFNGQDVHSGALALALVTSDLTYGVGLRQGFEPREQYHVKQLSTDRQTIREFWWLTTEEVWHRLVQEHYSLFTVVTGTGDREVVKPEEHTKEGIRLHRPIAPDASLHVSVPNEAELRKSLVKLRNLIKRLFRVRHEVCLFGISCVARYRDRDKLDYDLPKAMQEIRKDHPHVVYAGCFMDGEIGIDYLGIPRFGNWSVADFFLADEITPRSNLFLGFDALAKYTSVATTAPTVEAAMQHTLECIQQAGFPGGMISLVMEDSDERWIIGQAAQGGQWKEEVLPRTRRHTNGTDILALLATNPKPRYVSNTEKDDTIDRETARAAGVLSFYAIPLLDESNEVFGTLQIDLGDMRDDPELGSERCAVLDAVGATAAAAINRATRTEELAVSRRLDRAVSESLNSPTVRNAAQKFVEAAAEALDAAVHVRLLSPCGSKLDLVAGCGPYPEALQRQEKRHTIDCTDSCASTATLLQNRPVIVNDTTTNHADVPLLEALTHGEIAEELRKIHSYANFPVAMPDAKPRGVISIASHRSWYFTPSRIRSLHDIGQRLHLLLSHIEQRREVDERARQTEFLLRSKLRPDLDATVFTALRSQVKDVREAAHADRVSCYLWDEVSRRYVLRAQSGWVDPSWLDAAWYDKGGDSMTGRLALSRDPQYISNLRTYKQERQFKNADSKYFHAMFGAGSDPSITCEAIVLPLWFKDKQLGVVTLHCRRPTHSPEFQTAFSTVDAKLLAHVADSLSAQVYALQQHDRRQWEVQEAERLTELDKILLRQRDPDGATEAVCQAVVDVYHARRCDLYLSNGSEGDPLLVASQPATASDAAPRKATKHENHFVWSTLQRGEPQEKHREPTDDVTNPSEVRKDGAIERVALPLRLDDSTQGVLDIHWRGLPPLTKDGAVLPHHSIAALESLAANVSTAIDKDRAQAAHRQNVIKARDAHISLTGMALYLARKVHDIRKGVREFDAALNLLHRERPTPSQKRILDEARPCVEELKHVLKRARAVLKHLPDAPKSEVPIHTVLNNVIRDQSRLTKGASVDFHLGPVAEVRATVVKHQIQDAFEIILENAVEAMANNPPDKPRRVNVSLSTTGDRWVATFTDSGKGMTQDAKDTIMSGDEVADTSMGLILARRYCELHGGDLHPQSAEDEGTTVRISVPIEPPGEE